MVYGMVTFLLLTFGVLIMKSLSDDTHSTTEDGDEDVLGDESTTLIEYDDKFGKMISLYKDYNIVWKPGNEDNLKIGYIREGDYLYLWDRGDGEYDIEIYSKVVHKGSLSGMSEKYKDDFMCIVNGGIYEAGN